MDLIERQAAIDEVENVSCSDGIGISALKCEAIDDAVRRIRKLPSAQPEHKTCFGCVHEHQVGWQIDICGSCIRCAEDHYERRDNG